MAWGILRILFFYFQKILQGQFLFFNYIFVNCLAYRELFTRVCDFLVSDLYIYTDMSTFIILFLFAYVAQALTSSCPCKDASLCDLITGPPVQPTGEIYGFIGNDDNNTDQLNWTHVTTVAWANPAYMCAAHAHGARAVIRPPSIDLSLLLDASNRTAWVNSALYAVEQGFYDGIVFDYESPQAPGSAEGQAYALLINETSRVFHEKNPSYQISVCVAWSPDNIDGRAYPYLAMAEASDLVYVMDYDTRSQIFDACIASANAPFPGSPP